MPDIDDQQFANLMQRIEPTWFSGPHWIAADESWSPPAQETLPIDEAVAELLSRKRAPRIDTQERRRLRWSSPYSLARGHLEGAWRELRRRDRKRDARVYARCQRLVDLCDSTRALLLEVVSMDPIYVLPEVIRSGHHAEMERDMVRSSESGRPEFPPRHYTLKAIHKDLRILEEAFRATIRIRELANSEITLSRVSVRAGAQQVIWKRDFVEAIAWLWHLLTGTAPSKKEGGLFENFVHAAWQSYDEDMPEVSFAWTIREVADSDFWARMRLETRKVRN